MGVPFTFLYLQYVSLNHPINFVGGWCATCDVQAVEGDELFCGNHSVAFKTLKKHWGWCDNDCSTRGDNPMPKSLLRTTVKILDDKQCVSH